MQLRVRQWLSEVDGADGLRKWAITQRGQEFLEKWFELQNLAGIKNKQLPHRVYLRKELQLAAAN